MRVADVMTQASVSDSPADTLRAAAATMWGQQTGSLVVTDSGRMVGIITERDILKAVAHGVDLDTATVADVMTKSVLTATPNEALRDAAREMAAHWIRHLPVVVNDQVVGMLSMRDVTGVFAALSKDPAGTSLDVDQLVRERRLARIEVGDLD